MSNLNIQVSCMHTDRWLQRLGERGGFVTKDLNEMQGSSVYPRFLAIDLGGGITNFSRQMGPEPIEQISR